MATRKKRGATSHKPRWVAISSLMADFILTALLPILTAVIAEVSLRLQDKNRYHCIKHMIKTYSFKEKNERINLLTMMTVTSCRLLKVILVRSSLL